MSRYPDRIYPVHRYEDTTRGINDEVDAKVFGSGFVSIRHGRMERTNYRSSVILIDPADIERLEEALKEAKRRRNGSARRRRRKLERERLVDA